MNKIELQRVAAMAHELRRDWPAQSILTTLHPLAGAAYGDVAVAAAACYTDPDTETPARLLQNGPWWNATRLPSATIRPTTPRLPWCGRCDQRTRLIEVDDTVTRCPSCHPLIAKPEPQDDLGPTQMQGELTPIARHDQAEATERVPVTDRPWLLSGDDTVADQRPLASEAHPMRDAS